VTLGGAKGAQINRPMTKPIKPARSPLLMFCINDCFRYVQEQPKVLNVLRVLKGQRVKGLSAALHHACCRKVAATQRPTAIIIHVSNQSRASERASAAWMLHIGVALRK
jgi:hypothetical protein